MDTLRLVPLKRRQMDRLVFQLGAAAALAALAAFTLQADALDAATAEIVAFLSIVMAAVLPTMLLSATILKGEKLTVAEIAIFRVALDQQMSFWIGMLVWTLVSILALIFGKASAWQIPPFTLPRTERVIDISGLFVAVVVFSLAVVAFRFPAFVRGIRSLMRLHLDELERSAKEREGKTLRSMMDEARSAPDMPGSVGRFLQWPDRDGESRH